MFCYLFLTHFCLISYTGKPQENPLVPGGEITNKQYGASKSVSFVPGADLLDDENNETGIYFYVLLELLFF